MAVTATPPGQLTLSLWQALRAAYPIKCMLINNSWTFNKDTSRFRSEVTGEVTGTGYTAGGKALTGVTETYDAAVDTTRIRADDVVWDAAGGVLTANRAVFYIDTGNAATSPIVTVWDFGGATTATNAPFTVKPDAAGLTIIAA